MPRVDFTVGKNVSKQRMLSAFLRDVFADRSPPSAIDFKRVWAVCRHVCSRNPKPNTLADISRRLPDSQRRALLRAAILVRRFSDFQVDDWASWVWWNKELRESLIEILQKLEDYGRIREAGIVMVGGVSVFFNPTPLNLLPYVVEKKNAALYLASSPRRGAAAYLIRGADGSFSVPPSVLDALERMFPGGVRKFPHMLVWTLSNQPGGSRTEVPGADELLRAIRMLLEERGGS